MKPIVEIAKQQPEDTNYEDGRGLQVEDMKRQNTGMVLMLIFIVSLLFFWDQEEVFARDRMVWDGLIDLRNHSFESHGSVKLEGRWRFFWGQWHKPGNPAAADRPSLSPSFIKVPANWNHHQINGKPIGGKGFATYAARILLPPDIHFWSVRVVGVSSAFTLYINGEKKISVGTPAKEAARAVPKLTTELVDVYTEQESMLLVFHVSNHHHFKGGLWEDVFIGPSPAMHSDRIARVALSFFFFGAIFLMGLYHLRLYVVRQKEKTYLFFSLFCLLMSLRIFVMEERMIMLVFPGLSMEALLKLEYLSFYLGGSTILAYLYHLFPDDFQKRVHQSLQSAVLVFSGVVVFFPAYYFSQTLKYFQMLAFVCIVVSVWVLLRAFKMERFGIKTFLTGILVFAGAVANDMLFAMGVVKTVYLFHFGSFVFILCQAAILIRKYSRAFETMERQEADLHLKNEALMVELKKREEIEAALQEREALLNAVVENAPVPMLVSAGRDETVLIINRKFTEVFGYDRNDISELSAWWPLAYPDEAYRAIVIDIWTGGDKKNGDVNMEALITCKDGSQREVNVQAASVGETRFAAFVDLSEYRDSERKRKELEDRLRQSQKMESIGTIAGGVAHDFNNILSIILGNAELALSTMAEKEPATEQVGEIKNASLRAAGIIKQLLNFSRRADIDLRPINAVTVVRDALKLIRATMSSTIEMVQALPSEPVPILADPIQVDQLLLNLCTNAAQAMEESGGVLEITLESGYVNRFTSLLGADFIPGRYMKLIVRDTGPGINPDIMDRIFDPYFTTKEVGKGSGLGLSVVLGIVKSHHGAVSVNCNADKGSAFTILLPMTDKDTPDETAGPDETSLKGRGTVLFVDDEPHITVMNKQILERMGFKVIAKTDPADALSLFVSMPDDIDLVITDMAMPKMTGARLSRKILDIRPDIPVIICTGYSVLMDEQKAKALGISAFIMKPIQTHQLVETIRKVMAKEEKCF